MNHAKRIMKQPERNTKRCSAAPTHQGYVYVEAEKEAFVKDAAQGLTNVLHSKGVRAVKADDMVPAIRVTSKARGPHLGRIRWWE